MVSEGRAWIQEIDVSREVLKASCRGDTGAEIGRMWRRKLGQVGREEHDRTREQPMPGPVGGAILPVQV